MTALFSAPLCGDNSPLGPPRLLGDKWADGIEVLEECSGGHVSSQTGRCCTARTKLALNIHTNCTLSCTLKSQSYSFITSWGLCEIVNKTFSHQVNKHLTNKSLKQVVNPVN